MRNTKITTASKGSPLIVKSLFKGYDTCMNPYVGCEMGCCFCYVRFFVKDKDRDWGEFLRIRQHLAKKLPKEIDKIIEPTRLVIGTMTEPFQPQERKHRITRKALEIILSKKDKFKKVGIFTRSPIVLEDIELIKQLPGARVHVSISPFSTKVMQRLEPIGILHSRRLETARVLKEAGIRVQLNIAPCLPFYSEHNIDELANWIAEIGAEQFFVDPMQAYDRSFAKTKEVLEKDPEWAEVEKIVTNKKLYAEWKAKYWDQWKQAWGKVQTPEITNTTLAIWNDHETHVRKEMMTGTDIGHDKDGDEMEWTWLQEKV